MFTNENHYQIYFRLDKFLIRLKIIKNYYQNQKKLKLKL